MNDFESSVETLRQGLRANLLDLQQAGGTEVSRRPLLERSAPPASVDRSEKSKGVRSARKAHSAIAGRRSDSPSGPPQNTAPLKILQEEIGDCRKCELHKGRKTIVHGAGNPSAKIMFVGQAPGAEDDRTGNPFSGAAGDLLDRMLEAMSLSRDAVFLTHLTLCRPMNDRDVTPEELTSCRGYFQRQVATVRPELIVGFGRATAQTLLKTNVSLDELRGRWHQVEGIPFMSTYHPAFLLHAPERKREAWKDLQAVLRRAAAMAPRG